jgi:hypothetical protein
MPLLIHCDCGKQLRVGEQHAGRRVRCPGCGESLPVPDPKPITRKAGPAKIRFDCVCGKVMQARAEYAGQPTRCPECGKRLTIPGEDADDWEEKSAIRAGKPASRRPAPLPDEEDEEEDRPARRRKARGVKKKRSMWPLLLVLGGVLFLMCGGGVGGAIWWFWGRGPDYADTELVSSDAKVLVGARAADLWQDATVQKLVTKVRQMSPDDPFQDGSGVTPDQVSRVLWVGIDPQSDLWYMTFTTTVEYDREKVLGTLTDRMKLKQDGFTYHVGTEKTGKRMAVFFAGKKVLVIGPVPGVERCMSDLAAKKTDTGLVSELDGLLKSNQVAVIGKNQPGQGPGFAGPFPPGQGLDFSKATVTLKVGASLDLRATVNFLDEAKARQAKAEIDKALNRLKLLGMIGRQNPQVGAQLRAFLDSFRATQAGTTLTVSASMDTQALGKMIDALPQAGGPPGGFPGGRPGPFPPGRR